MSVRQAGQMSDRAKLRAEGRRIRQELGLDTPEAARLLPGLGDLQDEMLFGRVWARPILTLQERMLATLSALTSAQHLPQLAAYGRAALHIGVTAETVAEVMLHCAIYSGQPTLENSLAALAPAFAEFDAPPPEDALAEASLEDLMDMGQATMRQVHAEGAEKGYADPNSAASELYYTAIQYLYGAVWNHPGPSVRERMICSIACFTTLQLTPQQRKWFPSAQKNVGLSRAEILEVIAQTGHYSGFPPALNAMVVAGEVLE